MSHAVTQLIEQLHSGEDVQDELFQLIYDALRNRAGRLIQRRARGKRDRIGATSLAHEAYIRLWPGLDLSAVGNRSELYAMLGRAMFEIVIDTHRSNMSIKRGGEFERVKVPDFVDTISHELATRRIEIEELKDALRALREHSPIHKKLAEIVEMRFFVGLSLEEIAETIGSSKSQVGRDWQKAQNWLAARLGAELSGKD